MFRESPQRPISSLTRETAFSADNAIKAEAELRNETATVWRKFLNLGRDFTPEQVAKEYEGLFYAFLKTETEAGSSETAALAKWHLMYGPGAVLRSYNNDPRKPDDYVTARNLWADNESAGISAEEINAWPEVRQSAVDQLEVFTNYTHPFEEFLEIRNKWIGAGVISAEEVSVLPLVIQRAMRDLHNATDSRANGSYDLYVSTRDQWASVGVFNPKEIAKYPYVKELAETEILKAREARSEDLAEIIERWVMEGTLTNEEAAAI